MIKKTVTYTDFNGDERTDTLYFNLSMNDLVKMRSDEKMNSVLEIVQSQIENQSDSVSDEAVDAMLSGFREIITRSYGEKSDDGKTFRHDPDFEYTAAYDALFMRFVEHPEEFIEFVDGIIPTGIAAEAKAKAGVKTTASKKATSKKTQKQAAAPLTLV